MANQRKTTPQKALANDPLQQFVDSRKRPALFVMLNESLERKHALKARTLVADEEFDDLDLVIHSGGGNIHAAYQIVEVLRFHCRKVTACVPLYAKSAATLLCIGSDEIVMDELAELGPLDTQVSEEKRPGKRVFGSALNPFKTLEQLQTFALTNLDLATKMIIAQSGMDLEVCVKHAMQFVKVTTGPLFDQLNPEKLGEYRRALSVGEEYGKRLLTRYNGWNSTSAAMTIERLVHGYPSHDYIIDFKELNDLGLKASLFPDESREAVQGVISYVLNDEINVMKLLKSRTIEVEGRSERTNAE